MKALQMLVMYVLSRDLPLPPPLSCDTYLHLHGVQLVPQLELVGDLVDGGEGGEAAQAAAKLVADLLQRSRHLGRVHRGVHGDTFLVSHSALSGLSRALGVSLYKEQGRRNIAGPRTPPCIFIWKSWETFIPKVRVNTRRPLSWSSSTELRVRQELWTILKYCLIRSHHQHHHLIKCVSYVIDTFSNMSNIGSGVHWLYEVWGLYMVY